MSERRAGAGTALAAMALLAALGGVRQALQLRRAVALARGLAASATAYSHRPAQARARVLLLGDSTGVGVGAGPRESLAALLAADHREAELVNLCCNGVRLADAAREARRHLRAAPAFDFVIVHAGGNDVLRGTRLAAIERDAHALAQALRPMAGRCAWLGPANVGRAPVFAPPLSWWLSQRTRAACGFFEAAASAAGITFVNFFHEAARDPYSADAKRWFAADRLHPSAESYRDAYRVLLQRCAELTPLLHGRRRPQATALVRLPGAG